VSERITVRGGIKYPPYFTGRRRNRHGIVGGAFAEVVLDENNVLRFSTPGLVGRLLRLQPFDVPLEIVHTVDRLHRGLRFSTSEKSLDGVCFWANEKELSRLAAELGRRGIPINVMSRPKRFGGAVGEMLDDLRRWK
jgi:hypothetical protein